MNLRKVYSTMVHPTIEIRDWLDVRDFQLFSDKTYNNDSSTNDGYDNGASKGGVLREICLDTL